MIERKELLSIVGFGLALAPLLALCFWLTSLDFGDFRPESPTVTFVLWALSICVVLGTIALGFLLFRNLVKLYIERRRNKLGSRIKTKLISGVVALSIVPIALHVYFSITVLSRNLDKWFSQPTVEVLNSATRFMDLANEDQLGPMRNHAQAIADVLDTEAVDPDDDRLATTLTSLSKAGIDYLAIRFPEGDQDGITVNRTQSAIPEALEAIVIDKTLEPSLGVADGWLYATALSASGTGFVFVGKQVPAAMLREQAFMRAQVQEWQQLEAARPLLWRNFAYILGLITIFMLFIAVWMAQYASRQITRPIEALVTATDELAGGHLDYRVKTPATDEFAGLVASFNSMSQALESKTRQLQRTNRDLERANTEIDERRRFIDTILQSITPGVVSVDENGKIVKFNESARQFAGTRPLSSLQDLTELLEEPDRSAFEHMFSRARRTGVSTRDFDVKRSGRPMHLAVTLSSLDSDDDHHGFVIVLEDTTEIMRAKRSEAWQEVARRLAHEIKNPLTPVALAAGRIDRLLARMDSESSAENHGAIRKKLAQSTETIYREVQSLKSLVDSFSDLARFPAVRPERTDLNALVREAVRVFDGRLPGVRLSIDASPSPPWAKVDPEPFKRVIVNLIDNAAEVVQGGWMKEIVVSTRAKADGSAIELSVADSGPGISPEDKQKLFVPYFSTKERGTGLGLSIVRSVVQDHQGTIRVEDNFPTGTRFIIEVPAADRRALQMQEVPV